MDERTTDPPADENAPQPPVPRTGEDGKPVYDQEFFLALARQGKEVWNKWRDSDWNSAATFAGTDFRRADNAVRFADFQFGDDADFSNTIFGDRANFSGATFGDGARFHAATFGDSADFFATTFWDGANFSDASFGNGADFSCAVFGGLTDFSGATFGDSANLSGATFGIVANLSETTFGQWANLSNATFGYETRLCDATFQDHANLHGAILGRWVNLSGATFDGHADFRARSLDEWKQSKARLIERKSARHGSQELKGAIVTLDDRLSSIGAGPDSLVGVLFANVRFYGIVDFSGRKFKDRCDFRGARFNQPPVFNGCDGLDRLDFYGAKIRFSGRFRSRSVFGWATPEIPIPGWTLDTEVALRLRRLRRLAEETMNHDLERDLYIEERKAERGMILLATGIDELHVRERLSKSPSRNAAVRLVLSVLYTQWANPIGLLRLASAIFWILVMSAYRLLADYGRSFVRPMIALGLGVFLFHRVFSAALIPPTDPIKLGDFRRATWAFAISNAVPFVGALTLERDVKLTLLCGDRPIDAQHAQASGQPICVPIPGRRFQLLALGQSIFSALCIFFAGLALRNYFKLR